MTSPIDGLARRYNLTPGNLVTRDQTVLTTVVSLDPMYTYVDIDEATVLQIRRAVSEGRMKPVAAGHIPVLMGLQHEDGFPRKGVVDFINNQVNPASDLRDILTHTDDLPLDKVMLEAIESVSLQSLFESLECDPNRTRITCTLPRHQSQ